MLSRIEFIFSLHSLLGNQSSHINNPSNNLNVKLCVRSQVTRKLHASYTQGSFKLVSSRFQVAQYHPEALKYFSNIGAVFLFRFAAEYLYFSSSSAISYLVAFNYSTGKMDAQYHPVN